MWHLLKKNPSPEEQREDKAQGPEEESSDGEGESKGDLNRRRQRNFFTVESKRTPRDAAARETDALPSPSKEKKGCTAPAL